jgi:hypothetical protein
MQCIDLCERACKTNQNASTVHTKDAMHWCIERACNTNQNARTQSVQCMDVWSVRSMQTYFTLHECTLYTINALHPLYYSPYNRCNAWMYRVSMHDKSERTQWMQCIVCIEPMFHAKTVYLAWMHALYSECIASIVCSMLSVLSCMHVLHKQTGCNFLHALHR